MIRKTFLNKIDLFILLLMDINKMYNQEALHKIYIKLNDELNKVFGDKIYHNFVKNKIEVLDKIKNGDLVLMPEDDLVKKYPKGIDETVLKIVSTDYYKILK